MRKLSISFLLLSLFIFCFATGCSQTELVEIHFDEQNLSIPTGEVYIGGEINVPGIYPLQEKDTIEALLQAAGGLKNCEGGIYCQVRFSSVPLFEKEQKIDLNRAPAWLLKALPGIGEVTAQNIVSYRIENGLFRHVKELMNVDGIGEATFNNLAGKITVLDTGE